MSDRLDIVRLIDARVAATRRIVARSKHLANAAKDDLSTHEEWLDGHRQRSEQDLERHQRRLRSRRKLQACKRFSLWVLLLGPSLSVALYRRVASALCTLGHLLARGSSWIDATAYDVGRGLISLLARGIDWIGEKSLAVIDGLWLSLSLLGVGARDTGLFLIGAVSQGLSWLGPKALSFGHSLGYWLSLSLPRLAVMARDVSLWLGSLIKEQSARLTTQRGASARAPDTKRAVPLDPHRLQQAAFVRLRAEHDRLQARIHAMDKPRGRRVLASDGAEWAQLRQLALNARRLFEVQQRQVLGAPMPSTNGGVHSLQWTGTMRVARAHPLRAGHAIYEAPALAAGPGHPGP